MFENPEAAFGSTTHLLGLIEMIYAAVQEPRLWAVVLEQVTETIHGESLTVFAQFPEESMVVATRTDPLALDAYANYYASINPLSTACDQIFPDGEVRYGHLAMSDSELEKSEFYNDFFKPFQMHHSMGVKIPLGHGLPAAYLTCQRPKRRGPFEDREGLVYRTLLPHLERAFSLHLQMTRAQSHILGLEATVNAFEHAVIGLDREGRIALLSHEAESLLREADGIQASHGLLSLLDNEQNTHLQAAIQKTVSGNFSGNSAATALLVQRQKKAPLQLTIVPHRSSLLGVAALAALVFLGDPSHRSSTKAELLRTLYALSPSEARVADLLAHGLTLNDIADQQKLSIETVRFHTKKILTKTGTRRQAELIKLVLSLPTS